MALNFPTSPELNQVYTSGTRSWRWDGSSWVANNSVTNILGYIPVNKAGDTMSGGLNVPNLNAVTVTANSGGFSIAGGSSASKTLTVSNSVTVSGTDGSTLNIGAGGTLQSGAFQVSSQGTTGATGAQGTTGAQGATGTQGALGTQGSTGAQGTVGGAGIQGATGSQGATGTAGAQGTQGTNGSQGTSGSTGAQGSTGTQGAVGSTGGTGATGSTGVQGSTGAQGATGSTGSTGSTGAQGTTGATGAQGTSGATILGNNNAFTGANTFPSISVANSGAGHDPYGAIGVTMPSASNYSYYGLTRSGVIGCAIGIDTSNNMWFGQAGSGYSGTRTATWFYGNSSGDLYGTGSVRAPVFYDSDNTNYYVNPNGGSVLSSLNFPAGGQTINTTTPGTGAYQLNFTGQSTSDYAQAITWGWSASGAQAGIYVQSSGNYGTKMYFATTDSFATGSKTSMSIDHGGTIQVPRSYLQSDSSLRAPIFYDSNDTAYYCDPASTSRLNAITYTNMYSSASSAYGFFGNNVYVDTVNSGAVGDPLELCYARGAYTITSGSMRAPIFYDSDNTGYYLDPASTSNLNVIAGGRIYAGWDSGVANSISTNAWFRSADATGWYNASYGGGIWMSDSSYVKTYGSKIFLCDQSVRSPIFYDSDNTGYYLDPASTSELNRINTVRSSNWIYMDNHYGDSLVGAYNSTIFQGVFAMGDSYKLTQGGGINNLYGICWSHPNAGGIAGNLDSHGLIVAINGGFGSCMAYSIKASSNVTAYSDERLKKDWADLPKNYVEQLAKVKVGTYTRIDGEKLRQVGVSAQSLKPLLPEAVIEATDDFKTLSVAYGNAAMASAVELAKEVVTLKEQLNIVMERLKQLENK